MRSASIWMCGVAALAAGAGLLFAILGPTIATSSTTVSSSGESHSTESTRSLLEDGIEPVTWAFIGLVAAGAAVLGGAAIAGLLGGNRAARPAALFASVTLVVLAVVSGFSIGLLFLPGALLGVVGAALWSDRASEPDIREPRSSS